MSLISSPATEARAEIVSIGTELLLGEITDINASWLAQQLPALGIPLYRIQQTGDNRARLETLLREAWERANLLILTGGLGPTEDDVTREAIADLLGENMVVVPALAEELRAFFARRGREMPARNVKQATLIPSANVLENPIGTAPGWWVARDGRYIAAMPGVPVEMRRMWTDTVVPRLLALPRGGIIVSRTLKILGIGESAVEHQLGDLVRSDNPTVATYAKNDGIHVRMAARSVDTEEAWGMIAAVEEQVRTIFGESIYGVDNESLAAGTARMLAERRVGVAVAEAGLGGALCTALAGERMAGALVLPPDAEIADRAAAEAATLKLAQRAQNTFGAPLALSACVAPFSGGRTYIAAALTGDIRGEVRVEEHNTDPTDAPRRGVLLALQLLRDQLRAL